ncbi:MAG: TetR family transcriptional regulator [Sedimenticola sp.]|nr:TetR family transcriptional regulator [Sedimenticola sp.]MCW8920106.1 TetR family transcriptional regulator [Sedimenticola sp.]MCW8948326.1 TetR family transcriptional regulator [Sedimenticola sp.]MCW8975955.1 TetR family transcriptional regulator [Sedimenticola sp.]
MSNVSSVANPTLNDIANTAGMTRGTVYWHFDNKDAVIRALWERNASTSRESFTTELRHLDRIDPARHFQQTIKELVQQVVTRPELGQTIRIVMHSVEFTDEQTDLQRFLNKKHLELHSTMEQAFLTLKRRKALNSPLPASLLSQAFMSYLLGLIHIYLEPGLNKLDLKKNGDQLLDLFLIPILKFRTA